MLNRISLDERERWVTQLADLARRLGIEPTESSIVGVPVRADLDEVQRALSDADVAASIRAGDVRISFHIYNTPHDVEYVCNVLELCA